MSTVSKVNFEPVRDVLPVVRASFALADPNLADPHNAVALVDGEWMTVNASDKLVRAADVATGSDPALTLSFPLWHERGRYDGQAMSERKLPILWMGGWEFNTRIFDATATVGSGAAITAMFQPLKVATITIGTRNYVGIVGHGGSGDANQIVGHVTRLPANNGGRLRMRGGNAY